METFEKVVEKRNPIFHIDLDPQQNIQKKANFKNLLKEIENSKEEACINLTKKFDKYDGEIIVQKKELKRSKKS